jgi:peptidoglycan/LPS O-acetylase OafA/YrhL
VVNVKAAGSSNETRVIFLDNLRYFFVLCVVLQHAANAYNGLAWWPVAGETSNMVVG